MKDLILRVHDFLASRKGLVWLLLALLLGVFLLLASRMDYQEDISAFLPHDAEAERYASVYEQLGGNDKVAVFFEMPGEAPAEDAQGVDLDALMSAMDCFEETWFQCDSLGWVPDMQAAAGNGQQVGTVLQFILANAPYFLTEADYARIDSLLAQPGYVRDRLAEDKQSLYGLGSGMLSTWLRNDPLGLFTPLLNRLGHLDPTGESRLEDGYLLTPDGQMGVVFFNSPFGSSESDRNGALARLLEEVSARVEQECPGVEIFATGGPLVAVENAARIKKDSLLALAIALVLIALVLWLSFRRFSDVLWIAVTILFGAAFALAVLSLFKSSISIIVLGIGSMIIGIAVNYPLHYVDHLKYQKDRRKTLADQINPLLVGNITTVGAFLSLLLLKADALHDFGAMGALLLVGTILFVLFFLPVLVPEARRERRTLRLDWDSRLNPSRRVRRIAFAVFLVLTVVFFFLSRQISFDSDMRHINYMTDDQRRGFDLLAQMGEDAPGVTTLYAVAEAPTAEEAVARNEALLRALDETGEADIRSLGAFLPSAAVQEARLSRWESFKSAHPGLLEKVQREARSQGFSETAFTPFYTLLAASLPVQPVSAFDPVTRLLGAAMYLPGTESTRIVNYVKVPEAGAASCQQAIRAQLPEGCFCFHSADVTGRLVDALSGDFDKIGLLCSLIVFFFLWFSFRSIELSITSFLPLAIGWIWILGMMRLFGLQFNIVNIILATFIFGQGDDYTIFITEGLMYEHACGKKILRSYKNCVMLSALIMFIGIGALVVARHPAMQSLAYVTIVGMFTVVVMAYYLPPLVFRWLTRKKGEVRPVPVTLARILSTFWVTLVFGLALAGTALWGTVSFLFGDSEKKRLRYHRIIQRLCGIAVRIIPGSRFTFSNPYGEDFSKPAIYVCNHQSHFDVLSVLALQPKLVFMTNEWAWKFYGPVIRKAEFYPASYGLGKDSEHIKRLMERGYSVVIFPEGTRNSDCSSVLRFHRGAFQAAQDLGLDILPIYLHGFGYVLPKHEHLVRKADLYLEVGQRQSVPEGRLAAFTRQMRHLFVDQYDRIRRERETAAYNATFVRYQYLYKGEDARREMAAVLKAKTYAAIDAIGPEVRTIAVTGSGCGVYALLLALTHRDKEVYAFEADEEKHLTAVRCTGVPANLHHYRDTETPENASFDLTIAL